MAKKNITESRPDFRELIRNYNDEELIKVLKKRSHYIPEAAEFAINEAIKRGIIHSEQDLFGEKFREEKQGFSWFPVPENAEARKRIRASILRSLVFVGAIPVIYGGLQMYKGEESLAETAVAFGLVWLLFSFLMTRKKVSWFLLVLGVADIAAGAFIIKKLFASGNPFMDFFVIIVVVLMVLYGLNFIRLIDIEDQKQQ